MRDTIVYSGTRWESWNVLERFSVALTLLGARVLYCDNPISRAKHHLVDVKEIEPAIFRLKPRIWGHRLNIFPPLAIMQSRMVVGEMIRAATNLQLQRPLFIYSCMGRLLPICAEMKRRGYTLVHVCMDYPEPELMEHASVADQILVIPRAGLEFLQPKLGDHVTLIPQLGSRPMQIVDNAIEQEDPVLLHQIPHPRLAYLGVPQSRLRLPILQEVLAARPQWHFVYFGPPDIVSLANAHALPWMAQSDLDRIVTATDVGFMPYNCGDERELNCVPLKILDHFQAGKPVVSTPIISSREFSDVIYFGESSSELIGAVERALSEPPDSPKRGRRKQIAREHSLENIAALLSKVLPLYD